MKKYKFEITAIITKTVEVVSEDLEAAEELANELFDPNTDGADEVYDQQSSLVGVSDQS